MVLTVTLPINSKVSIGTPPFAKVEFLAPGGRILVIFAQIGDIVVLSSQICKEFRFSRQRSAIDRSISKFR